MPACRATLSLQVKQDLPITRLAKAKRRKLNRRRRAKPAVRKKRKNLRQKRYVFLATMKIAP
jgi:hypothetical protein